ncbi:FAD-dependent oxidoreductase [Pseudovibrio sp. SPO723]|uniref:NAD(P)/FAD-dependent oxidoreductase n=1 Tax=Nesiotobacter zosterae TaxID=392721 RepID=UPI0029C19999|nr:FAD-dependent oxidoreductase [Pseudovibrio sp. SPO723]MDX5592891.1 FAD-dependent oxidoreductase [Pseudovibrio sp. SPO723]
MLRRLYSPAAFDPNLPVGTYWSETVDETGGRFTPPDGALAVDFAVIGAGYTGLNAALRLSQKFSASVAVLDAGWPGWGASGRSGGFCCMGGARLSESQIERNHGLEEAQKFAMTQVESVAFVRELTELHDMEVEAHGNGEWALAHCPEALDDLRLEANALERYAGLQPAFYGPHALAEIGMAGPHFHGAAHIPVGFALNPARYVEGLTRAVLCSGVQIFGHSPVTGLSKEGNRYLLHLPKGVISAENLLIAVNGYGQDGPHDWFAGRHLPVLSNVMVTRALSPQEQEAQGWTAHEMAYDTRNLLHYFRLLPNGRFLFGMRGGTDAAPEKRQHMFERTRQHFDLMFPAWSDVEATHFWSGFVCMNRSLAPYIGAVGSLSRVWTAAGYHGNGIAMASWAGKALADFAAGYQQGIDRIPAVMQQVPKRFPLSALRLLYLKAAYCHYQWVDGKL